MKERTIGLATMSPSNSYHRSMRDTIVLFPDPDGPTMAVILPAGNTSDTSSRTLMSGRPG